MDIRLKNIFPRFFITVWHYPKIHRGLPVIISLFFLLLNSFFPNRASAQERLHVRVGAYDNPPKISIDSKGNVNGFWPDLLADIATRENWDIEYIPMTWAKSREYLLSGYIDIMPDVGFSEERNKLYAFSEEPVITSWSRVYVKNDNDGIQTILDLDDKKIGGLRGSINIEGLDGLQELIHSFNLHTAIVGFDSYRKVFQAIKEGSIDGGVTNRDFGDSRAGHYKIKRTPIIFQPINMKFAFPKSGKLTELLRTTLDRNLNALKKEPDSIYYKLLNKYFEGGVSEKEVNVLHPWIKKLLLFGLGALFITLAVVICYRVQIRQQTRELREKNKKLRQSEAQYRLLTDNTLDVIWAMNMDLEFTYVNPAITNLTGHSPEEWIGSQLSDHFDANYMAEISRIISAEIAKGPNSSGATLEAELFKKNKEPVPVEIHGRIVFDDRGQPSALQGTTRNISERKQAERKNKSLERQLIQAQKMEAVGRLAGGVAHDFNNMLTLIIGYSELALEDLKPGDPFQEDFELIYKAGKKSADIVQQLLAFSRQQTIHPKMLDLNKTIENMLKMLQRLIGENINLTLLPGDDLWPVKIDVTQVDQTLANLCVNARDAIADVGKITIQTNNMTFDEDYCTDHLGFIPGDYVMLSISDDGCGMDKETRDKIFEPFFTTKALGQGTGLGLATVYGIVKQNNGFIYVYSEPEEGTTFRIYLPRFMGEVKDVRETVKEEIARSHDETVLVVEDEDNILEFTRKILEGFGYTVLATNSANEAINLVENYNGKIDLLITDVILPQMNGRELSERLLTLLPGLKCIFTSGYPADVIAHHGILEKGVDFIQKPVSRSELAAKIREVLKKNNKQKDERNA